MAVRCEFIDIIIPIVNINRVYEGGYKQFLEDKGGLSGIEWDDGILYRTGSMGSDVDYRLKPWNKLGLVGWNGEKYVDYCISEHIFGGIKPETCDWLITYETIAYYKPCIKPEKPIEFPAMQGGIEFTSEENWEQFQQALFDNKPDFAYKVLQAMRQETESYRKTKDEDKKLKSIEAPTPVDETAANEYINKALHHRLHKRFDLAQANYEKALSLKPRNFNIVAFNEEDIFVYGTFGGLAHGTFEYFSNDRLHIDIRLSPSKTANPDTFILIEPKELPFFFKKQNLTEPLAKRFYNIAKFCFLFATKVLRRNPKTLGV
ncbi:tetratricopeptide (TPR) repeat protein [Parabacteroides sp. PFB2-12]|uniref:hypothetical protein n=1 Tax=unclassified Parabacteroides TaxID=2649774 RepID=UPI0024745D32|nr:MULTISPECIES: hypothetical protein [unclassified Parabacteroides]MDH6343304.1 tetratricopeptide (TPR) repeat protein [Parabacteroides sp. PM6-13]MDH6390320.1 tetratricopeptide (TPR) repeat protein [Parabacteroides sp. PFB2-12]